MIGIINMIGVYQQVDKNKQHIIMGKLQFKLIVHNMMQMKINHLLLFKLVYNILYIYFR